ncbi:ATP-binding protein [Paenibacillus sp. MMS20-IR301]|uniref:ATP-binding protein n=1 Tax=Paenibacillus sp. MMS20-IR301 TaxID=2895946 RepID=UPI0028E27ECA|nr:ATP-binding protein [Paenibacillus sp. MMS20-IR301]WNS45189.1 ATP-binding protein [Paenibacillus sp. MMS20-IR301]
MNKESVKYYLRYVVLILFFLMLFLSLQWVWQMRFITPEQPRAEQGVIDFRGWDFNHSHSLLLDGEWAFYPSEWLTLDDIPGGADTSSHTIQVPGSWKEEVGSSLGYGTYLLRILIDQPVDQPYVFWIHQIQAASEIEVNGKVLYTMGDPDVIEEQYRPESVPFTVSYDALNGNELIVIIRAANFDHGTKAGISYSIRFGTEAAVDAEHKYSMAFQFGIILIFMLHVIYSGILFIMSRERDLLIFMFLLICTVLSVASDNDALLLSLLPLNYTWGIKIKLLAYLWMVFFNLLITYSFSGSKAEGKLFKAYRMILSIYSLYLLAFPIKVVLLYADWIFGALYVVPALWMLIIYVKMVCLRKKDTGYLLFSACAMISGVLWGFAVNSGEKTLPFYPVDILAAIIGFTAYWLKQFFRKSQENQKLTQKLLEDHRDKDQFLVQTSHILKNPLEHILRIAHSQFAVIDYSTGTTSKDHIGLLIQIGNRMSLLLDDLLDAPLLDEQGIQMDLKDLDIRNAIMDVINMLQYLIEGKPVEIQVNCPATLPYVHADEKKLSQILYNLLHNAIKYTEQGEIIIEAVPVGDQVKISIRDTGIGMDEETAARIFKPYEQGSQMMEGGIGLGLSISKWLAELHHSQLTVYSKPNEGSTFSFSLTASANGIMHPEESEMIIHPVHGLNSPFRRSSQHIILTEDHSGADTAGLPNEMNRPHILIVMDDPVQLKVLNSILSEDNYSLTTVSSTHEVLDLLRSQSWDLLIADVKLPQMPENELLGLVRQHYNATELPILLLISSLASEEVYRQFISNANDYVTKPIERVEFKYRVQALISLKQSVDRSIRMETAYLQAQIKPHFLFNTMNSIMALSEFDLGQMRKVTNAFTDYLKYSVDFMNSSQLVSLENEISLVKAYLFIEKIRFEDRLSVIWDIQPDIQFKLPPLSIQPLVENAVRHGLLSRTRGGELIIRIYETETAACVQIIDNGKGIAEAEIEAILSPDRNNSGGIGLRNTNRRLIQRYGHGLRLQSKLGTGTTVSFLIPFNKEADA